MDEFVRYYSLLPQNARIALLAALEFFASIEKHYNAEEKKEETEIDLSLFEPAT